MARIVEHLSVEELEARYRTARDVAEARHAQAIWLLAQGRTVLEVAEVLAFAPRWVTRLAARYNAFGPDALGDRRRHNGKAAGLLTPDLLAALAERVRTPPEDGGLWSGPKVALWVRGTAPDAAGWRGGSGWRRCTRSAAGRRCGGSAGPSRRRGRGIRARPRPSSGRR